MYLFEDEPDNLFEGDDRPIASNVGHFPKAAAAGDEAAPVRLRDFADAPATRGLIFDRTKAAIAGLPPLENQRYRLRLGGVDYLDPAVVPRSELKRAQLHGRTVSRRLGGTWTLEDIATGKPVATKKGVVAHVPYYGDGGTFLINGSHWSVASQMRLRPGVYTRRKENGEYESHIAVNPGTGVTQRIHLDPETGVFKLQVGGSHVPLASLLREQGVTPGQMAAAWGHQLAHANLAKADPAAIDKLHARIVRQDAPGVPRGRQVAEAIAAMPLDPEVTRQTLGKPHDRLGPEVYLAASRKLLAVSRGEAQPDDRDHLSFMTLHSPEDLIPERVTKDQGPLRRAFWKATMDGSLDKMPGGIFTRPIMAAIQTSGLGQPSESINPMMVAEQMYRVTRMGVGGLPGVDSIPMESRAVQPSHLGFIDPVATPENLAAGVDLRMASGSKKGSDGRPYAPFRDVRSGQAVYLHPGQLADATVAFPGEMESGARHVRAIDHGRMRYVRREQAQYQLPEMENAFSTLSNLVPMKSGIKGQRLAMGARMTAQALPLAEPEAPHVQTGIPGSQYESYEQRYGKLAGAVHADADGVVEAVHPGGISVRGGDGQVRNYEIDEHLPSNRKTGLHSEPLVQPGQPVKAGQILARSNYTDASGAVALGRNLRIGMLPGFSRASNFEDSFVISESAARKLTSDHYYQHEVEHEDGLQTGKAAYVSAFPTRFERRLLENFDEDGVIKPGTVVEHGHPLILAVKQREPSRNRVYHGHGQSFTDKSELWDHHSTGVVTDVAKTKDGVNVVVKTQVPMQTADKLSNRFGAKGLVGAIMPDDEMPVGADGRPLELLYNPAMTVSRINPTAIVEMALGKVAEKTGHPYRVQDFRGIPSLVDFADAELKKHGMTSMEPVVDPQTGRKIPAFVGNGFIMKLHHMAASKRHGRGTGGYSAEGLPARGIGETSAKRMALGDVHALLSHGATNVIRDALYVRGQANPEYWARFMAGQDPPLPRVPFVHEKFFNLLKASGVNPVRENRRIHLMALTDRDTDALAEGRSLRNADLVDWKAGLKELPGGLFDPGLTGGHAGTRWSALPLAEPMPNPIQEEPIRRLLGLTEDRFRAVLGGREKLGEETGPHAIAAALARIDVPREIERASSEVRYGRKSRRDDAIKKLGFLRGAQDSGLHPKDWVWSKVPVIPPLFRPVSVMQGTGRPMIADANILYGELHEADRNLRDMTGRVDDLSAERLAVYDALKAVTGLGDPIHPKTVERNVKGALKEVLGPTGKYGFVQRKLLSAPVDVVGRTAIIPNPDLDLDQVGLPESTLFEIYRPFIVRRLVRAGMPRIQALREVAEKTDRARQATQEEIGARPVILTRAPVLHRYGVMAFKPKMVAGDAVHLNPFVTTGYGADFDGDCCVGSTVCVLRRAASPGTLKASRDCLAASSQEIDMAFPVSPNVLKVQGEVTRCRIEDFPRVLESARSTAGGNIIYDVPSDVEILTRDPVTGKVVFMPVTAFSIHPQCEGFTATCKSGRAVGVSRDHSLYAYDRNAAALRRMTPEEAVTAKAAVPVIRRVTQRHTIAAVSLPADLLSGRKTGGGQRVAKQLAASVPADFEFGWWLGACASDAWSSWPAHASVAYAKTEPALIAGFRAGCRRLVPEISDGQTQEALHVDASMGLDAVSTKTVVCSTALAKLFEKWFSVAGRGARHKRLPPFFVDLPEDCLFGILAGLIDGDGTVSVNNSKKRTMPQTMIQFATSSEALRDDVVLLGRLLGVRIGVSPTSSRGSFTMPLSTVDAYRVRDRIKLKDPTKQARFAAMSEPTKDHRDLVPIPYGLADDLYRTAYPRGYARMTEIPRARDGQLITRTTARYWLSVADECLEHPDLEAWRALVEDESITWDRVESLEPLPAQTMYDITVPGTGVFAIDNGLIIYDTMNFHVPVEDAAVQDAVEKMLPSKNLFAASDFKVNQQVPIREYAAGLYLATREDGNGRAPIMFATRKDAVAAHRRGEIDADQPVEIVQH